MLGTQGSQLSDSCYQSRGINAGLVSTYGYSHGGNNSTLLGLCLLA